MPLQYSLAEWEAQNNEQRIFSLPGVNIFTVQQDTLHVVDKGVSLHVLGNVLFQIIQDEPLVLEAGNLQARVDFTWFMIQKEYDLLGTHHRSRIPTLTMSMLGDSEARSPTSYPCLSSVKAAHVKHLVRAVLALLVRFNRESPLEQHRLRCVACLAEYYRLVATSAYFMSAADATLLLGNVHSCILHYCYLASFYASRGQKFFLVVPKMHAWFHQAVFARYCNPRTSWTYANEDYVGRIATVAQSVVRGTGSARVGGAVVRNFLTALQIRCNRRLWAV